MPCPNPKCVDYQPNCTNYSYVCPSCTNCCPDTVNAKCVVYKGSALDCINVATNDKLDVILSAINAVVCNTQTFDLQCLGLGATESLPATIQALIDDSCAVSSTVFNTTCLGGSADRTIYQAMSNVITKICNSDYTYPVIDTSCMTGGAANDDLTGAVEKLVEFACTGPTYTLDWEVLEAPDPNEDTPLQDILDSIVHNLRCSKITFDANQFDVTANVDCTKEVELAIPEVSQQILDEIEGDPTKVTQLRDMGLAKMFASETCEKNSIEEKLNFSEKFNVTRLSLTPHQYIMTLGTGGANNVFTGIIFPNGIYHETLYNLSNISGIQTWLNSLNLGTFAVASIGGNKITITVILDGDLTSTPIYHPIGLYKSTSGSTTVLESTYTASQTSVDPCDSLRIDIDDPDAWQDVNYLNLWTGNVKYRYNKINKTVEIKNGYVNKSINPSFVSPFSEQAFEIPNLNVDGLVVWKPYAILVNSCLGGSTDCVVNARLRMLDGTDIVYVDIDDCTRSETPCSPGDIVTVYVEPSFYYVA